MASEDFFLYRNLLDGQGLRGDGALNLRFSDHRTAEDDSGSIWWGGQETRGDRYPTAGSCHHSFARDDPVSLA